MSRSIGKSVARRARGVNREMLAAFCGRNRMERVMVEVEGRVPAGAVRVTSRVAAVAALFGIEVMPGAAAERVLFERRAVAIGPGEVVLITGPSGAGKSTLLRALEAGLREKGRRVARLEDMEVPGDCAAVDAFACPLEEALGHLARAGLSEAHLLVRAPAEFSEGQQFRFRLARFFASEAEVLIADEFGATLDRVTARVVAWQLGKFMRRTGRAAVLATTHEDLAEELRPTLHLWKGLGAQIADCPLPIAH